MTIINLLLFALLLLQSLVETRAALDFGIPRTRKHDRIRGAPLHRAIGKDKDGDYDDDDNYLFDPNACLSDDGGDGIFDQKCGFPFTYKGTTYTTCTTEDYQGQAWCFHENFGDWGLCQKSAACGTAAAATPPPTPFPTPPPTLATPPPSPEPTDAPETPPPSPEPTPLPTEEPPKPTFVPTPKATPEPTLEPTPEETPSPTRSPTPNPTPGPTEAEETASPTKAALNDTKTPTASPSAATTTEVPAVNPLSVVEEPTVSPTEEPTSTPVKEGNLISVQLTPFAIRFLIEGEDRLLLGSESRTDVLYDLVNVFLLEDYKTSISQPVEALQLLLLTKSEHGVDEKMFVVTEQVLGSVYFRNEAPTVQELDEATHTALTSAEFVEVLQASSDAVLQETVKVEIVVEGDSPDSPTSVEGDKSDSSGSTILGMSTSAFIAVVVVVVCGLLSVCILVHVFSHYRRNRKEDKEDSPSDTPKTTDSKFFEDQMVEVKSVDDGMSDLESVQSTYSYLPGGDDVSLANVSVANSFLGIDPSEETTPKTKTTSSRALVVADDTENNLLSAAQIESELDRILNEQGRSTLSDIKDNSREDESTPNSSAMQDDSYMKDDDDTIGQNTANFSQLWQEGELDHGPPAPSPTRQQKLTEKARQKDDRDWRDKYGIKEED